MPVFKDYNEIADRLVLPVNGKEYVFRGLLVQGRERWEAAQKEGAEELTDEEFEEIFAGDTLTQMRADGVPAAAVDRALQTAFTDAIAGRELAAIMWTTGGRPKALEAYVKAHRPKKQPQDRKPPKASKSDG